MGKATGFAHDPAPAVAGLLKDRGSEGLPATPVDVRSIATISRLSCCGAGSFTNGSVTRDDHTCCSTGDTDPSPPSGVSLVPPPGGPAQRIMQSQGPTAGPALTPDLFRSLSGKGSLRKVRASSSGTTEPPPHREPACRGGSCPIPFAASTRAERACPPPVAWATLPRGSGQLIGDEPRDRQRRGRRRRGRVQHRSQPAM